MSERTKRDDRKMKPELWEMKNLRLPLSFLSYTVINDGAGIIIDLVEGVTPLPF
jgi:hypothetical protein